MTRLLDSILLFCILIPLENLRDRLLKYASQSNEPDKTGE